MTSSNTDSATDGGEHLSGGVESGFMQAAIAGTRWTETSKTGCQGQENHTARSVLYRILPKRDVEQRRRGWSNIELAHGIRDSIGQSIEDTQLAQTRQVARGRKETPGPCALKEVQSENWFPRTSYPRRFEGNGTTSAHFSLKLT